MKKIAILTSGGDAPGMNACIRALVRAGIHFGHKVVGVMAGYQGLVDNTFISLGVRDVGNIIQLGGTILKTSRCYDFLTEEGFNKAVQNCKKQKFDVVVVIGGNGSINGAKKLAEAGLNVVAIPATIDNDMGYTDFSLGFDSAVNTVVQSLNNIRDSSEALDRLCVVEVMGRKCGDIALYAGVAAGAEVVLVPEIKVTDKYICDKLQRSFETGKKGSIVVVAEGVDTAENVLAMIHKKTKLDGRAMSIDYIQRGGSPTADDRVLGSQFGVKAIELITNNIYGVAIGQKNKQLIYLPIAEALNCDKVLDQSIYELTDIISN